MKPIFKKIIIIILGILTLVVLVNLGLNYWIDTKLPKIIAKNNDSPYHIKYETLEVSLISKNIKASKITVVPKTNLNDTINKLGVYANVTSVEIRDFKLWDILFSNVIKANKIIVNKPEITLYKNTKKAIENDRSIRDNVVEPFRKIIVVNDLDLNDGKIAILYLKDNVPILNAENITLQLEGIVITDEILERKIPFSYEKYAFSCDRLYYLTKDAYHIKARNVATTNVGLEIKDFSMISAYSRDQFVNQLPKEKDLFTIKAKNIAVNNMEWGFKKKEFFFNTKSVRMDEVAANIYRSKKPEDDLTKKPLYNKLLRELPFEMKVDTFAIRNSMLEYEEEKVESRGSGRLTFNQFNLTALNLSSGFGHTKLPDVKIAVKCRFMNASPMEVDWRFNVMDKSDGFNIKGSILAFQTGQLAEFTRPYINITTKGTFDRIYFNFSGNDLESKGDLALEYHDLKVTLYRKKKPEKVNKILTALGNLFVKKDTDNELVNAEVSIKRIPEKSFYNLLWRSIAEGLKKILV